jgi:hypothetical protein
VITPIVLLACLARSFVALRAGLHQVLWRHRVATAILGTPLLIVGVIAGDYLVSPLWDRSYLNETSPVQAAGGQTDATTAPAAGEAIPAAAKTTHRGKFVGADDFHFGRGDGVILKTAEGKNVLRFENFSVRNGPDLFVYLSRDASGRRVEESLNLGKLKATDGAFNYDIPANINLADVKSVVVWCKQFSVLFSVAELQRN